MASTTAHAGDVPLEICVAAKSRPESVTCNGGQTRLGRGDFRSELRFAPVHPSAQDPLVLRTASVWETVTQIRYSYADGRDWVLNVPASSATGFITIGAIMEYPVPYREAALRSIVIETRDSANLRGVVEGARLMSTSHANRLKQQMTALYAAFFGMALALIVYNMSLWTALRNRFQLYYATMVGALAAYTLSASGVLGLIVPSLHNNDRLRLNYILLTFTALTAMRFIRDFFEGSSSTLRIRQTIRWAGIAALSAALCFATFAPAMIGTLDLFYTAAMSALLLTVVPVLINARKRRNPYFWLFMLAWSAPIASSILRAAHGFGLIDYSFVLDNCNLLAFMVEALLSSLMVTLRLRALSSERDEAREGEQLARRLANTDPLTGLLNRRAFLDLAIGRRAQQRLLLIDVDHFKAVNDKLGHEGGDRVLCELADLIQQCRPPRSLAVRLGGEEFALLVPLAQIAKCTPDSLLEAVRAHQMPQGMGLSISIGIAEGQIATEDDWKRLYRLADGALYRAKADGRNRACRATDFRVVA
ncbi:MAG: diguanylate cyclase [Novosphingobium sp.]